MTRKKIDPTRVELTPSPSALDARSAGTSVARLRARALRAWKRGERPDLEVSFDGHRVEPEQIDWEALPPESSTPGGTHKRSPRSLRLSVERESRLADLAKRWGVSENEAAGRAIDVAFSAEDTKS